jgi:hypothetical protein
MRSDVDRQVEARSRDLELGAALARLPQPELPEELDDRLRSAVEGERRRNLRRPGWPELLVVLAIVLLVAGTHAWRHVPPVARKPVGAPAFVRRNWDGSIMVRIGDPLLGEVEDVGDLYVFRRVDGRWLIDEIIHRGN